MHYKRKGHRGRSKKAPARTQGAGRATGNSKAKAMYGRFARSVRVGIRFHQSSSQRNRISVAELD